MGEAVCGGRGGGRGGGGGAGTQEISMLYAQFCREPKIALKK